MKTTKRMLITSIRLVPVQRIIRPHQQTTAAGRRKARSLRIDRFSNCHRTNQKSHFLFGESIIMITRLCLHPKNTCLHTGTLHTASVKSFSGLDRKRSYMICLFFNLSFFHLQFTILCLYFPDRQHFRPLALLFFVLSYSFPPPIFSTTIFFF